MYDLTHGSHVLYVSIHNAPSYDGGNLKRDFNEVFSRIEYEERINCWALKEPKVTKLETLDDGLKETLCTYVVHVKDIVFARAPNSFVIANNYAEELYSLGFRFSKHFSCYVLIPSNAHVSKTDLAKRLEELKEKHILLQCAEKRERTCIDSAWTKKPYIRKRVKSLSGVFHPDTLRYVAVSDFFIFFRISRH